MLKNNVPILKGVINTLITMHGGAVICVAGPEGCGKTTLIRHLEQAAPEQTSVIYFSKALTSYCDLNQQIMPRAVRIARKKISKREKDLDPILVAGALRHAIKSSLTSNGSSSSAPGIVVIIDGWPRLPEQAVSAPNILGEFFTTNQPAVLLEAECDFSIAAKRALITRAGDTDTEGNITRAHAEFKERMPHVRRTAQVWADHILVNTEGTEAEALNQLEKELHRHVALLQGGSSFRSPGIREVPIASVDFNRKKAPTVVSRLIAMA